MYYCYIITTILLISRTINGAPRILNTDYEKTDLSTINNLKYKISEPDPSSISSTNTNTQSTGLLFPRNAIPDFPPDRIDANQN